MPATGANTTPVVGVSAGPSPGSQIPADPIHEGYREATARLTEAMREGAADERIRSLQGQVQIWQSLIQAGQNLSQPGQGQGPPGGYPMSSRGVEDSEKHLRNERKKDMDRLAKASNSPELRPKLKAHYLDT